MRGNAFGFSEGTRAHAERVTKEKGKQPVDDVDEPCFEVLERVSEANPARQVIVMPAQVAHHFPMCRTCTDLLCCCALTVFLVGAAIAIGVWYAVASSYL